MIYRKQLFSHLATHSLDQKNLHARVKRLGIVESAETAAIFIKAVRWKNV